MKTPTQNLKQTTEDVYKRQVLNTEDYQRRIEGLLDPATYRRLNKDPTTTVLRKTDSLVKQSSLAPDVKTDVYKRQ